MRNHRRRRTESRAQRGFDLSHQPVFQAFGAAGPIRFGHAQQQRKVFPVLARHAVQGFLDRHRGHARQPRHATPGLVEHHRMAHDPLAGASMKRVSHGWVSLARMAAQEAARSNPTAVTRPVARMDTACPFTMAAPPSITAPIGRAISPRRCSHQPRPLRPTSTWRDLEHVSSSAAARARQLMVKRCWSGSNTMVSSVAMQVLALRRASERQCTGASKCGSSKRRNPIGRQVRQDHLHRPVGSGSCWSLGRGLEVALVEVGRQEREHIVEPLLVVGAGVARARAASRGRAARRPSAGTRPSGQVTGSPGSSVFGSGCAVHPRRS